MNIDKVTQNKFKDLCVNLRLKGLRKTNSELLEIMMELAKKEFSK